MSASPHPVTPTPAYRPNAKYVLLLGSMADLPAASLAALLVLALATPAYPSGGWTT